MSLLPVLLSELVRDLRRPMLGNLYDQHFGVGLLNDEVMRPTTKFLMNPLRSGYLRMWRNSAPGDSGVSSIQCDPKNGLQINLDVQPFKPEELKVTISDMYIVVEGKHEELSDEYGFISRQFTRRYKLPDNVNDKDLQCSLSSDGVLQLNAPAKATAEAKSREIPISQRKQPAVKAKL